MFNWIPLSFILFLTPLSRKIIVLLFPFTWFFFLSCSEEEIKTIPFRIETAIRPVVDSLEGRSVLDTLLYLQLVQRLSNGDSSGLWPPDAPFPLAGAILPFNRIVAFYGNFYSRNMGILGALPPGEMISRLKSVVNQWERTDPSIPVIPAIHYIAVSAQKQAGRNGKFSLRMPPDQIEKALDLAKTVDGLTFLDIQVGTGSLMDEIRYLEPWLIRERVHLGIDPEFSMKDGSPPGSSIGTFDADDINPVTGYLAGLVRQHQLPPKMLIIHRFNKGMLTRYKNILTRPEVQLVIHMDGFGFPAKKKNSYYQVVYREPIQFAGFKLFYKNDTLDGYAMMSPEEILQLKPRPVYIQYH